jgi:hypothetical protein
MRFLLYFLAILFLGLAGCKQDCNIDAGKDIMGVWYKKPIHFPEKLELVNTGSGKNEIDSSINIAIAKFTIIHFFNADCDECVNVLLTAQKFIKQHPVSCNLQYIFIASGPSNVYVRDAIKRSNFSEPVYYEKAYYSFKKLNQLPLADKAYDTMLVNDAGELLLFGGAFGNAKAEDMFFNIVNCEKCQGNG